MLAAAREANVDSAGNCTLCAYAPLKGMLCANGGAECVEVTEDGREMS